MLVPTGQRRTWFKAFWAAFCCKLSEPRSKRSRRAGESTYRLTATLVKGANRVVELGDGGRHVGGQAKRHAGGGMNSLGGMCCQ